MRRIQVFRSFIKTRASPSLLIPRSQQMGHMPTSGLQAQPACQQVTCLPV